MKFIQNRFALLQKITDIPNPVWAVGFALEQTLRDAAIAVFSFADFKTASAYKQRITLTKNKQQTNVNQTKISILYFYYYSFFNNNSFCFCP
ncbi:MAG: hypothetical protein LBH59_08845 [Planctomycetaceae bacterium]|jgi:hypothetical protein|nr:hypothetical protein [Planctomycetaceae bacterium]